MSQDNALHPVRSPVDPLQNSCRGTITNSRLGRMGRFGNQLFQYLFLKTYAARHELRVEAPPWVGNVLFGTQDPPVSCAWPIVADVNEGVVRQSSNLFRDCDFEGYFQYHTSYYADQREYIRSLFRPAPAIAERLMKGWEQIGGQRTTIVGLHLRREDFGQGYHYITPTSWYLRWLDEIWPTLDNPVLFIASNDVRAVLPEFAAYRPVTCRDLGMTLPEAPYYPDFFALTQCHLMAIPNSTFSFAAAMLAEQVRHTARSHLPTQGFIEFDPWNDDPLHRAHRAENYPHVPGITQSAYSHFLRRLKKLCKRVLGHNSKSYS